LPQIISPSSSLISPIASAFVEVFGAIEAGFVGVGVVSGEGETVLEVVFVVVVVKLLGDGDDFDGS